MRLFEIQMGQDINLTTSQKRILAKIVASPDPNMDGYRKLALNDEKLVDALDTLERIQYVERDQQTDRVRVTDAGGAAMQEDGLTDENNQLTEFGKDLAYGNSETGAQSTVAPAAVTSTPQNFSQGNGGQGSAASPAPSPSGLNIPFQNEGTHFTFKDYLKII
jgi:DNA-binding MarR family transcriptional regulator